MSVRIYVEGGGDNKDTIKRCSEGFGRYCQKLTPPNRRPQIVACGGRGRTFDRFSTAVRNGQPGEIFVLLVDAECPVVALTPARHLVARDGWDLSGLDEDKVFLMVQAMEAWFLADRSVLAGYYGEGFLTGSLRGSPTNVEAILKKDLEPCMKHASKPTAKGEYHKTKHAFALLALIDPARVEKASPHARRFNDFLRGL